MSRFDDTVLTIIPEGMGRWWMAGDVQFRVGAETYKIRCEKLITLQTGSVNVADQLADLLEQYAAHVKHIIASEGWTKVMDPIQL